VVDLLFLMSIIAQSPESHFVRLREPGWAIYGNKTERLPPRNNTLAVFFQSWKYFLHVEDQLRLDLAFSDHFLAKARHFLDTSTPPKWRQLDVVRVVIHVRRGDYVTKGQQRFGWALPEPDYFNRSMAYFTDCLPRVQFVVLSNDIKWCAKNIVGDNVIYSRGHGPADDMAIASLCDHAIVTIGSYGFWSAWFANGITVTQKNFPTPKSPLLRRLSRVDYYKPEWIAL
jgi:galactoside 2-L-fucosyltransferase 1/2